MIVTIIMAVITVIVAEVITMGFTTISDTITAVVFITSVTTVLFITFITPIITTVSV